MWNKFFISVCIFFSVALISAPCAFAEDVTSDSSSASSDSGSFLEDSSALHDSVSDNFADGVDHVSDTLKNAPGELTYNIKDEFPGFIKSALDWIPLPYWWIFEFSIVLGFVNALYRRMS